MESKNFKTEIIEAFTNMDKANWLIAQQPHFFSKSISIEDKFNKIQTLFVLAKYYQYVQKGNDPYVLYIITKVVFNGRRGYKLDDSAHLNSFFDFVIASQYAYQLLSPNKGLFSKQSDSLLLLSIARKYCALHNRTNAEFQLHRHPS